MGSSVNYVLALLLFKRPLFSNGKEAVKEWQVL